MYVGKGCESAGGHGDECADVGRVRTGCGEGGEEAVVGGTG